MVFLFKLKAKCVTSQAHACLYSSSKSLVSTTGHVVYNWFLNWGGASPNTNSLVSWFIENTSLSIIPANFNFLKKLKSSPCSCLYPNPNFPCS